MITQSNLQGLPPMITQSNLQGSTELITKPCRRSRGVERPRPRSAKVRPLKTRRRRPLAPPLNYVFTRLLRVVCAWPAAQEWTGWGKGRVERMHWCLVGRIFFEVSCPELCTISDSSEQSNFNKGESITNKEQDVEK